MGIGTVNLSQNLVMYYVLFVTNQDCNLLSVKKLTHAFDCITKFFAISCVSKDSGSGRMIGNPEFHAGLYLLKHDDPSKEKSYSAVCVLLECPSSSISLSNKDSATMIWH